MDEFIWVGKIVNTFGIKGEVKVYSDFEYQERIFTKKVEIYIGIKKVKVSICSYRVHKGFALLTFSDYNNINDVLPFKGENIYVKRDALDLQKGEYLYSDLIGFSVYDEDVFLGIVTDYVKNNNNVLLKVKNQKDFYLPLIDHYIKEVNLEKKKIDTIKGRNLVL